MILSNRNKKRILDSFTEEQSPFKPTTTEKIFKYTANLSLCGTTYDAKHLDKFLQSEYSNMNSTINNNSIVQNNKQSKISQSPIKNSKMTSYTVRPSVAFLSMTRDEQKQQFYVDLYDGPSSLQKRDNVPTLKDKKLTNHYETERVSINSSIPQSIEQLKVAQQLLNDQDSSLRSPQSRRQELLKVKNQLEEYQKLRTDLSFFGKRERIMKNGWRHGVVGVEDADSQHSSFFYKDQLEQKQQIKKEKDYINQTRRKRLAIGNGTSALIEIGSSEKKRQYNSIVNRTPEVQVDIVDQWKTKKRNSYYKSLNTFERMFIPEKQSAKLNLERTLKLRQEEQKGREFNIINGMDDVKDKWINTLAVDGGKKQQRNYNNVESMKNYWKDKIQL